MGTIANPTDCRRVAGSVKWRAAIAAACLLTLPTLAGAEQPERWKRAPTTAEMQAYQVVLSVRHDAANGMQAPQVALDPTWPRSEALWASLAKKSPKEVAYYIACVALYLEAAGIIEGIAPLMQRPLWDKSQDKIRTASEAAKALLQAGDQCLTTAAVRAEQRAPVTVLQGAVVRSEAAAAEEAPAPAASDAACVEPPPAPEVRQQLMALARELDAIATRTQANGLVATERFFAAMNQAVSGRLQFLAQTPGEPATQIQQAIIAYLTNDASANHATLLDGAVRATEAFVQDPATAMGSLAGEAGFDAAGGGAARYCARASATAATAAAGRIAGARKAAARLMLTAKAMREFEAAQFGSLSPSDIPRTVPDPKGAPAVNPFLGQTNCFGCALAQDSRLGKGQPYIALPDGKVSTAQIKTVLAKRFGKARLTGPGLSGQRLLLQAQGVPAPLSLNEIVAEIEAGASSRGLVFLEGPNFRHVINVWNEGGRAHFYDAQSGIEATLQVQSSVTTRLYRTN